LQLWLPQHSRLLRDSFPFVLLSVFCLAAPRFPDMAIVLCRAACALEAGAERSGSLVAPSRDLQFRVPHETEQVRDD
jgi:hypothetical protein